MTDYQRVLAIDLGFVDSDAFVILAWRMHDPTLYVERAIKRAGSDVSATCELAARMFAEIRPVRLVIDTGGLGAKIADELRSRWSVPFHAARKQDKDANVRMLADDLRTGKIKLIARDCEPLVAELQRLQRNADTDQIEDGQEDHCIDALLYGWRECRHYRAQSEQRKPAYGSPEWYTQEAARERQDDLRRHTRHAKRYGGTQWGV